jgi:hypothetical protein
VNKSPLFLLANYLRLSSGPEDPEAPDRGGKAARPPAAKRAKLASMSPAMTSEARHEGEWIKTILGKGWFVYFRIHDPRSTERNDAPGRPSTRWDYLR